VALTAQPNAPEAAPAAGAQETLTTIAFDKDSARLPDGAREALAHLASHMTEDATLEVELLAYAAGDEDNASKARRLSLSRALAVRSFLIDQGVRSTRIEVRALGNKVPEGAPDRVDIVGQKRG
jgi:outer membrane protein OmpA-like peptidoglycan-associated protein